MTDFERNEESKKVYIEVNMDLRYMKINTEYTLDDEVIRYNIPRNVKLAFFDRKHSTDIQILKE